MRPITCIYIISAGDLLASGSGKSQFLYEVVFYIISLILHKKEIKANYKKKPRKPIIDLAQNLRNYISTSNKYLYSKQLSLSLIYI